MSIPKEIPALTPAQFKRLASEARFISRAIGRTVSPGELFELALSAQSLANAGLDIASHSLESTAA